MQPAPAEAHKGKVSALHVTALDGIRGIAVLIVIFWHASAYLQGTSVLDRLLRAPMRIGWSGVDLFFVLSGFLITGILLDTRESPNYFRSFYARRALRIFPLYYLVLGAILVAAHFFPYINKLVPIPHDRPFYFFYLNNWWPLLKDTWHGNIIGHFWSLAVEEQFYVLWSICVFAVPPKHLLRVVVGGIVGAFFIRCGLYAHSGVTRDLIENTFSRMDALLAGAFVAILVRDSRLLARIKSYVYGIGTACGSVVLALIYVYGNEGVMDTFGYSCLAFVYAVWVLSSFVRSGDGSATQKFLCSKKLTTIGKYSYGMYVYHVPILTATSLLLSRLIYFRESTALSVLFILLVVGVTFITAKMSFDLYESRFCA